MLEIAIKDLRVLSFLRLLTDLIRQGTAPGADLLCASRLIGLEKEDKGIRPIAIGDMIYRVAMKAILLSSFRQDMLLENQLGVNSPGGVEPAIFLLAEAIEGENIANYSYITSLDLYNAFNSIDRVCIASATVEFAPSFYRAASWAYNNASILVTSSGEVLASTNGVRQGDPLGPLLFSLALRPTLQRIIKELPKGYTLVAYLDDILILGKGKGSLAKAIEIFSTSPLKLNKKKSKEFPIKRLKEEGLKTLGTFIGPLEGKKAFLEAKIAKLKETLQSLKGLPKQEALLLLRASIQLLLRHLLRQLESSSLISLWGQADKAIEDIVAWLATRGPREKSPIINRTLIAIPAKLGGLGLPIHADLANELYLAAGRASLKLLARISPKVFSLLP